MKIPMPETSDWKSSCGSWEGFCKTVRKSIANNLGSGIIKFNKMTNLEKIAYLNEIWYNLISSSDSGHKDRDCHWYIETKWSYGYEPTYTVHHYGYILDKIEEECESYEKALIVLRDILKERIEEYRSHRNNYKEDSNENGW